MTFNIPHALLLAAIWTTSALILFTGCQNNLPKKPEELSNAAQAAEKQGRYEEALSLYDRASNLGHAPSQLRLAGIYEHGFIRNEDGIVVATIQQDRNEAERLYRAASEWYAQAAEKGDVKAQAKLAGMYYDGKGVVQDRERALDLYHAAAKAGNAAAQYSYAYGQYWTKGRYQEGLEWIQKSARQNHAPAQYLQYVAYRDGHGVEPSVEKALEWLRAAADQGYTHATRDLTAMKKQGLIEEAATTER